MQRRSSQKKAYDAMIIVDRDGTARLTAGTYVQMLREREERIVELEKTISEWNESDAGRDAEYIRDLETTGRAQTAYIHERNARLFTVKEQRDTLEKERDILQNLVRDLGSAVHNIGLKNGENGVARAEYVLKMCTYSNALKTRTESDSLKKERDTLQDQVDVLDDTVQDLESKGEKTAALLKEATDLNLKFELEHGDWVDKNNEFDELTKENNKRKEAMIVFASLVQTKTRQSTVDKKYIGVLKKQIQKWIEENRQCTLAMYLVREDIIALKKENKSLKEKASQVCDIIVKGMNLTPSSKRKAPTLPVARATKKLKADDSDATDESDGDVQMNE